MTPSGNSSAGSQRACMQPQQVEVVDEAHRMGLPTSAVSALNSAPSAVVTTTDRPRPKPGPWLPGSCHPAALSPLEAVPRGDFDDRPTDQVLIEQVADEDSDSVAAHLRDRSISVAIVHEPQGTVAFPASDMLGEYGAKQPIGANTRTPIADEANFSRSDFEH